MLFLAPLQGYTDYIFRNTYSIYYTGIDCAVSPFISLLHGNKVSSGTVKDVLPANNILMPVIPQLLGNNPEVFINVAKFLYGWGYNKINWNMGCPVKNITRKKRGSGLIPYPHSVRDILEKIISGIPQTLSVKIRLGLKNPDEIYNLIPVLNDFPLDCVIIHPRVGEQMYEGKINHKTLGDCLPLLRHEVIYNGDIFSLSDFNIIKSRYPAIQKWMIGRGVFFNPLLPSLIKGQKPSSGKSERERFSEFLFHLYRDISKDRSQEKSTNKVKDIWRFFSKRFTDEVKVLDLIYHSDSMAEIFYYTRKIFEEEEMTQWDL